MRGDTDHFPVAICSRVTCIPPFRQSGEKGKKRSPEQQQQKKVLRTLPPCVEGESTMASRGDLVEEFFTDTSCLRLFAFVAAFFALFAWSTTHSRCKRLSSNVAALDTARELLRQADTPLLSLSQRSPGLGRTRSPHVPSRAPPPSGLRRHVPNGAGTAGTPLVSQNSTVTVVSACFLRT